jgi:hypothetical protein
LSLPAHPLSLPAWPVVFQLHVLVLQILSMCVKFNVRWVKPKLP